MTRHLIKENLMIKKTTVLTLLCLSTALSAGITEQGPAFTSIRQLAMGGTGVAITYDEHALYQNPAGLKLAKFDIDLPKFRAHLDVNSADNLDTFQELFDAEEVGEAKDVLSSLVPSHLSAAAAMSPIFSLTLPGFGVGAFSQADVAANFKNKFNPKVETQVQIDVGGYLGYAFEGLPFLGDKIMTGISAGFITRQSGSEVFDASTFASDEEFEFDLNNTVGMTYNLGFLMPYEKWGNGYVGLTFNNLFGTLSSQSDDSQTVEIEDTITLGLGHYADLPLIGETLLAADFDVVSYEGRDNFLLRLGLGAEKKVLYDCILLRGGVNDGYIVGGFGFDLWILQVNYAYHAAELGDEPGERALEQHAIEIGLFF